jgi:acyl-CoA reductase-like NAD-dependent aldehyde dehydrogenase
MTTIHCPINGVEIGDVPSADSAAVDEAFSSAAEALPGWRSTPPSQRCRVLRAVAEMMRSRIHEIAETETLNTGKSLHDTRREAIRAAECFEYFAGWADKATGTTIPVTGAFHTYTTRQPYGTAVGIIPWNVPYFFAAKKIAPAIAFGNVSIVKPAAETPLTALALADIVSEAGMPDGVVQVLTGGADTGRALVEGGRADLIVFTGHHATGKAVARAAAEHLVPVALELGGKSPQLVFDDADLDAALDGVMLGIFGAAGQMCIAGSRLFVHSHVYDDFVNRLASRVERLRVGDPRRDDVNVGPQVTAGQRDKSIAMIERGLSEGARRLAAASLPTDPELAGGYYVAPTVFADVGPEMTIMREEIFGPVLAVGSFADEADAVAKAHETDFGLAAGIWTRDVGRAHRVADALNVGTVWINTYRVLSDLVPFGGVGLSGYGREGGADAVELYTRTKSVWTSTEPGVPRGFRL